MDNPPNLLKSLEREMGLEPTTSSLGNCISIVYTEFSVYGVYSRLYRTCSFTESAKFDFLMEPKWSHSDEKPTGYYLLDSSTKGGICSGGIHTIFPSSQTTMLRPAFRCSSKALATPRRTPISNFRRTSSSSAFLTGLLSGSGSIRLHHTPSAPRREIVWQ